MIDADEPHVNLIGTDTFLVAGDGVYVELGEPDPHFPAFANCATLGH